MQVNEHLECFSQRPVSARRKGLPGNRNKVSQPALIGQSQTGFVRRHRGPPRFTPPVCFPSPDQHESFTCCLLGFAALDTTKKVTEGCWVQNYDLLIWAPLNSSLTALGMGHTLRGIIGNSSDPMKSSSPAIDLSNILYIRQPGAAKAFAKQPDSSL